jgi:hypothetical protein
MLLTLTPGSDISQAKGVAIGDGARWIGEYWNTFHPQATQILDYYHVVEKIGQWASLLFTDKDFNK